MCYDTQGKSVESEYLKNNYFQSWHTLRHNTRAGFDSAPLVSVEKACSSIKKEGPPLGTVRYSNTNQSSLLLTW
jgi:hypothetical protein